MRWWLSFCDPGKPKSEQFLGICLVEAVDQITAVKVAHALGINPGGQVAFQDIHEDKVAILSFDLSEYYDRFIPRGEALALSDRIRLDLSA